MPTWSSESPRTTTAWSDDIAEYHICCTLQEEHANSFIAVIEENGDEIYRVSLVAPSLQSALPRAIALRRRFQDRIDGAVDAELERLAKLRPGAGGDDRGA